MGHLPLLSVAVELVDAEAWWPFGPGSPSSVVLLVVGPLGGMSSPLFCPPGPPSASGPVVAHVLPAFPLLGSSYGPPGPRGW
eukprot:581812-Heterocapsa_arctica.AAC.1